jgi:hypothetical protein
MNDGLDPEAIDPQHVSWDDAAEALAEHQVKTIVTR